MKNIYNSLGALALVAVGIAGYYLLGDFDSRLLGSFEGSGATGPMRAILGFLLTLLGTILGSVYRTLHSLREEGIKEIPNILHFVKSVFRSVDLWIGFSVAPIVFALLLSSTNGVALSGFAVIALQNGFFCHAVVEKLRQRV